MNNFTPRAQQVLTRAREEAARFNHNDVVPEHLLLGLISLGQGTAANILQKMGLDLKTARAKVEILFGRGTETKIAADIPYSYDAKKVLALAGRESKFLNHSYVGAELILLGLIFEDEGVTTSVLRNFKLDIEHTRYEVLKELDPKCSHTEINSFIAQRKARLNAIRAAATEELALLPDFGELLKQIALNRGRITTMVESQDFEMAATYRDIEKGANRVLERAVELWEVIESVRNKRNAAVRSQNFEMAAALRDTEEQARNEILRISIGWLSHSKAETIAPSPSLISRLRVIGIDFGTHKTLVARWDEENSRPVLVRLRPDSGDEMPTTVYINESGCFCFGDKAEDKWIEDPDGCKRAFKRDLGAGITPYLLQGSEYSASRLAWEYLRWLKARVETDSLHGKAQRAVVTVPATFSPAARHELREAAMFGGFDNLELLDEPVAAGYAFLRGRPDLWKEGNLLVFDWGAGTLDLAMLRLEEGLPEVIPGLIGGKLNLGGEDIDWHLMQMVNRRLAELGLTKLEGRKPEEVERVRRQLIQWKMRHGSNPDGVWQLTGLSGVSPEIPLKWTSKEITQRIEEKVGEAMESVRELVERAGRMRPSQMPSGLLLIGGTSQLPSVKMALERTLSGVKVVPWEQQIAAVALGAAWKAAGHESRSAKGTT